MHRDAAWIPEARSPPRLVSTRTATGPARLRARTAERAENVRVTLAHPMLDLFEESVPSYRERIVADGRDRVAWLRARSRGVTATDAARLTGPSSVPTVVREKTEGRFAGNAFTDHGRRREPEIAAWASRVYEMTPSSALFHAPSEAHHLATPDGLREREGRLELCEIKTTSSAWRSIPRSYLRQVWWQQYVLGAERTLVVWEQHDNFVPVSEEPEARWVDRDDAEIARLIALANEVLSLLRR